MAQKLRHGSKRGPFHDEPGGERVTEIVPGEILDLRDLECRLEGVLHVLHGFTRLATRGMREHIRRVGDPLRVQQLQGRERGRV